MQGVATGDPARVGLIVVGQQPAEFDRRQVVAILGQHVELQIAARLAGQADAQLAAGEEIVAFAQDQGAVDQLAQFGGEGLAVEFAAQLDVQFAGHLGLRLQPAQAEDGGETVGVVAGQQGQADHQRNAAHAHQRHRAARATPVTHDEQQGQWRQQTAHAPQQAGGKGLHHQPDHPKQDQQQATDDQQSIHQTNIHKRRKQRKARITTLQP
ncbi:hypothetical protein D3C81_1447790 [compost metagenome]